jgi:hypothetical protein
VLSATIHDCGPYGLVRRYLRQGFRLWDLLVSFAVTYVKGFVFGIDATLWRDSAAWAASFIRAQDDVGAQVDASLQADIASVFALVVTFCRSFCNTFALTFCITVVFSKRVRRKIASWTASIGLTRGTSDLRESSHSYGSSPRLHPLHASYVTMIPKATVLIAALISGMYIIAAAGMQFFLAARHV